MFPHFWSYQEFAKRTPVIWDLETIDKLSKSGVREAEDGKRVFDGHVGPLKVERP